MKTQNNKELNKILKIFDLYGVKYEKMSEADRKRSYRDMEKAITDCGFFKKQYPVLDIQLFLSDSSIKDKTFIHDFSINKNINAIKPENRFMDIQKDVLSYTNMDKERYFNTKTNTRIAA